MKIPFCSLSHKLFPHCLRKTTRPRGLDTKGQGTGTGGVEGEEKRVQGKRGGDEKRFEKQRETRGMGKTGTWTEEPTKCLYVLVGNNEEDAGQNNPPTLPFRWSINPNLNIHLRALIQHLPVIFVLALKVTDVISF